MPKNDEENNGKRQEWLLFYYPVQLPETEENDKQEQNRNDQLLY